MSNGGEFWRRRQSDPAIREWAAGILAWALVPGAIIWGILILVRGSQPHDVPAAPVIVTVVARLSGNIYTVRTGDTAQPQYNLDDPSAVYNPSEDPNVTVVTLHGSPVAAGQQVTMYRDDDGKLVDTLKVSGGELGGTTHDWILIGMALVVGIPVLAAQFARRTRKSGNDHYARVRRRRRERDAAR